MAGRDHPSSLAGVFGLPFAEQIAFFRSKLGNLVPTQRWDDLIGAEHDRAFMVAGAAKADLLNDLAMAVDKAISEGRGIDEFRRDFRQIVARNGWTGWTGEGSVRGEAWRVGVIYRTNAYTSYAAGRLAQLRAGKFKFWVYRHGGSLEPRPVHLGWDGLVLPPEHPFWATHYPPSDWGCSCYVVGARSEAGARRLGGKPDKQLAKGWDRTDPKTGAPIGIGKGWGYAPGGSVAETVQSLIPKLDGFPIEIAARLIEDWVRSDAFRRWANHPSGAFPLVRISAADADAIGSKQATALLSSGTMEKQTRNHPELDWTDYSQAQRVVSEPTVQVQDTPSTMIYVKVEEGEAPTGGHVLVVRTTLSGEGLFVTSFRRLSRDAAMRDRELRRLLAKGEGKQ